MSVMLALALMAAAPPTDHGIPKGARLHVLLVAIDKYDSEVAQDLNCSVSSAESLAEVLSRQKGVYVDVSITKIYDRAVTRAAVKKALEALAAAVGPDDQCIIFFSGSGTVEYAKGGAGEPLSGQGGKRIPVPGSYHFLCHRYSPRQPETQLTAREHYAHLAKIRGRVLLLLDACHSGALTAVPDDLARDVSRAGRGMAIIAACQADQEALEPLSPSKKVDFVSRSGREYIKPGAKAPLSFFAVPLVKAFAGGTEPLTPRLLLAKIIQGQEAALAAVGVKKGSSHEDRLYSPAALLPDGGGWQIARFPPPK